MTTPPNIQSTDHYPPTIQTNQGNKKNPGYIKASRSDSESKKVHKKGNEIIKGSSSNKEATAQSSSLSKKQQQVTHFDSQGSDGPQELFSVINDLLKKTFTEDMEALAKQIEELPREAQVKWIEAKLASKLKVESSRPEETPLDDLRYKKIEAQFNKELEKAKKEIAKLRTKAKKTEENFALLFAENNEYLAKIELLTAENSSWQRGILETKAALVDVTNLAKELNAQFSSLLPTDPNAVVNPEDIITSVHKMRTILNKMNVLLGLPTDDSSLDSLGTKSEQIKIPSHEAIIKLRDQVSALAIEITAQSKKLVGLDIREQDETQRTFKVHAETVRGYSERALAIKTMLAKELQELQKEIHWGKLPHYTHELLEGISKISSFYTVAQMKDDTAKHTAIFEKQLAELEDMVTTFCLINDILNKLVYNIDIAMEKCENEKFNAQIEEIKKNLENSIIDYSEISVIHIREKLIESDLVDLWKASNEFRAELRNKRIALKGQPASESEINDRFQIDKAQLLEYNRKWNSIVKHVVALINDLSKKVEEGKKNEFIPTESLFRVALIQNEDPTNLINRNESFTIAHKKRSSKLNELISKYKQIYDNFSYIKKEINRTYSATLNGGQYTTETVYNWNGKVDEEVEETFVGMTSL